MQKAHFVNIQNRQILVFLYKSEKYFIAEYPFLDIATQGRTEDEALANIREAVEIHMKLRGPLEALFHLEHIVGKERINSSADEFSRILIG